MRLIIAFALLIFVLVMAFDLYNYGIELKQTPLLMTNPLYMIQAFNRLNLDKQIIANNCPEIEKYRKGSPYTDYDEIPIAEWNKCISATAPSPILENPCLEAERSAQTLLNDIKSQNELVLGLEKYGIRFFAQPAYKRIADFADNNICTVAVNRYIESKGYKLSFQPSNVLNTDRFKEGLSDMSEGRLTEISSERLGPATWPGDIRVSTLLILAGIFIFLLVIYTIFASLQGKDVD